MWCGRRNKVFGTWWDIFCLLWRFASSLSIACGLGQQSHHFFEHPVRPRNPRTANVRCKFGWLNSALAQLREWPGPRPRGSRSRRSPRHQWRQTPARPPETSSQFTHRRGSRLRLPPYSSLRSAQVLWMLQYSDDPLG